MKKINLKIGGMSCSACSNGLEKYLNKQTGVISASVNLVMANALIEYDESVLNRKKIEKFVKEAGFESLGLYDEFEKSSSPKASKLSFIIFTVLAVILMYISMGSMIGLPEIPFLAMHTHDKAFATALLLLTIPFLGYGFDIIKSGFKNLFHKTPNMDTLVTLGVLTSFIYSVYSVAMIFTGHHHYIHNLYFESAAIVIYFIKLGRYIDSVSKDKTKEAVQSLVQITPKDAVIKTADGEKKVTIDEIQKGDIVVCRPGERIAVDGTIVAGKTHLDESFITGESKPAAKEVGAKVIAGSINFEGTIKYRAEKIGRESTVSEIVRLVANATSTKAPIAKVADKISGVFVPTILVIASIAFVIWCIISRDFAFAINIFVSILVVACPCSLGLATPLAIVIASGNASKKGILIKQSEALENSHKVKTICFDKTGTLTKGVLSVSKIYNYTNLSDAELLKDIASIEKKSEHPIAMAIVNKAIEERTELEDVKSFKAIPGFGLEASTKEDNKYLIGNRKLMEQNNIAISSAQDEESLINEGNSILFVAKNDKIVALIGVKDVLKDNVVEVIEKLKKQNIEVVMLTGDNEKTARNNCKTNWHR